MENRIARAVERVLGARPAAWQERSERGCTPNLRWSVGLENGARVFVKAAVNVDTANWLRAEYRVYSQVQAPFLPRLLGWHDLEGEFPVLILENLDEAYWPPPWTAQSIASVRTALDAMADFSSPPRLRKMSEALQWLPGGSRSPRPRNIFSAWACVRRVG
jgi:hypothetical protein